MTFDLATALGAVWLVGAATRGFGGLAGRVLSNRVPVYLGRISYGVYLFHPLVKWAVFELVPEDAAWIEEPVLTVPVLVALTVAVAALSWHFLEAPLVRLKSRLAYAPAGRVRSTCPGKAAPQGYARRTGPPRPSMANIEEVAVSPRL
jgi:peptidoglycan/LPS O-acetylase OafA/YrhL